MEEFLAEVDPDVGGSVKVGQGNRNVLEVGALNDVEVSSDFCASAFPGRFVGRPEDEDLGETGGGGDLWLGNEVGVGVVDAFVEVGSVVNETYKPGACGGS